MAWAVLALSVRGAVMAAPVVRLGATQLTRTCGASSAASAREAPSTAPLEAAMTKWFAKPCCTATDEKKTAEPLFFFRLGSAARTVSTALTAFKLKASTQSAGVAARSGFITADPTQYATPRKSDGSCSFNAALTSSGRAKSTRICVSAASTFSARRAATTIADAPRSRSRFTSALAIPPVPHTRYDMWRFVLRSSRTAPR
mmetsp:Transcript_21755/g.67035  ORF Transcript_21755/g.67035 Transcript_21755/m.67035 type:complete len:201 (+) Transcript_21755:411-1013(+)